MKERISCAEYAKVFLKEQERINFNKYCAESFEHFESGSYAGERNEYGRGWSGVVIYSSPCVGYYYRETRELEDC